MDVSGIQKMTLLDFPGKCACTVFLAGCNLRCPFCHNASLVLASPVPAMEESQFFAFLEKRKGLLDGVCVTGGEPTLRRDLPDFLRKIRDMGYLVKLDTNGSNPAMLKKLLEGRGFYTGQEKNVLLSAMKKRQAAELKALVSEIDPDAFIILSDAHQVLGDGFKRYNKMEL